jgi:hypothetical protein
MIDGFTERARRVGALLEDPATTFLIVTAPRHEPVEEAAYLHARLRDGRLPFGGLVVNRVHAPVDGAVPDAEALAAAVGSDLAPRVASAARELAALAERDAAGVARLTAELGDPPTIVVPELPGDVHDVEGLALVRARLFGDGRERAAADAG